MGGFRRVALAALSAAVGISALQAQEQVVVEPRSSMRYLANNVDPGIGLSWTTAGFDDSAWSSGSFGVGYETGSGGANDLIRTSVPAQTRSIYTRRTFVVAEAAAVTQLVLGSDYDDGYAVWINGIEVFRSAEMPAGPLDWTTPADNNESSNEYEPEYEVQDISLAGIPALQTGENVLAIGVWNAAGASSDLVLVPRLLINPADSLLRGPYLQSGTATRTTVRWRTDTATDSRVVYGPAPGSLTSTVTGATVTSEHEVTLVNLAPDTTYYYAVGDATSLLVGNDDRHFFVTPPLTGTAKPTRVWVLGDSGTADVRPRTVRDAYYDFTGTRHTHLWLMLGDNAYPSGTDAEYQQALFDVYPHMLRRSVLWPTLGNHDTDSADSATQTGAYYDIFTLPSAGPVPSSTEAYYSFDYGNIHFVVLDSMDTPRTPGGAMANWLQLDLAATLQDWIVAFWHHPPYSKGSHDSDQDDALVDMREVFVPILESHGVDLVLAGHSHSYERSFLLDGHYGLSTTLAPGMLLDDGDGREGGDGAYLKFDGGNQGGVYVVAGSSGSVADGPLDHPAMFVSLDLLGSVVLDVDGARLDATFLDNTGTAQDGFTIIKSFGGCVDFDLDALCAQDDNCPDDNNPGQEDGDLDGIGDVCDACPTDPLNDADTDGLCADVDNCPVRFNPEQNDADGDGAGDFCDACPFEPFEDSSGADSDGDGAPDSCDCASTSPGVAFAPGEIGPTLLMEKTDGGTLIWRKAWQGLVTDLFRGTIVVPSGPSTACLQGGYAGTTAIDTTTPAPGNVLVYLVGARNACGTGPLGNEPTRSIPTPCATMPSDADMDGVDDLEDNCPSIPNPGLADADADFVGDACDNCPDDFNPGQTDADLDGTGDVCD